MAAQREFYLERAAEARASAVAATAAARVVFSFMTNLLNR